MTIRNYLTSIFVALSAAPAFAQEPAPIFAAETATPAMWRISDADSDYILLGTFHVLPKGFDWRSEAVNAAFAKADTVYFEIEADSPEARSTAVNVMMTEGFNKPGVTLSGMLDGAEAQALKTICAELGLPFAGVDPMRPWNAFLTLSVQFVINQGFDPGHGVDSVLLKESRARGKNIRYFETLEEQLAFFTTLAPDIEKKLLEITLRDWDQQAAAFDDLFRAWASGDVDFIDEQMNDAMRADAPEVYQRLIVERNLAWANELDAALKNESGAGFVAVGAGHLVGGAYSVPALLAAKGYDVIPYGEWTFDGAANDNEPRASQ